MGGPAQSLPKHQYNHSWIGKNRSGRGRNYWLFTFFGNWMDCTALNGEGLKCCAKSWRCVSFAHRYIAVKIITLLTIITESQPVSCPPCSRLFPLNFMDLFGHMDACKELTTINTLLCYQVSQINSESPCRRSLNR